MMPAEIRELVSQHLQKRAVAEKIGVDPLRALDSAVTMILLGEFVAQFANFNDMLATEIRKHNQFMHDIRTELGIITDRD